MLILHVVCLIAVVVHAQHVGLPTGFDEPDDIVGTTFRGPEYRVGRVEKVRQALPQQCVIRRSRFEERED